MADIRTVDYLGNALALPGLGRNVVTGTTGADSLTGTSGADTFISNGGADTLTGGAGDDTYVISDPNAKIVELAGGGVDTIKTLVNYVLPDNVENLVVYGFSGRSGTTGVGNSLANVITGDASNQILDGAGGNDVLTGGGGVDTFIFRAGSGHDVVTDFIGGAGGDVASLGGGLTFGSFKNIQDAMTQVGADVVLKLSGSDDVTFRNIKISDFTADNFTLPKPNFDGLKPTFDEEFNSPTLNVYDAKTKTGVWSTEFGYGGWGSKASHTISGYTGEKEIFVDSSYAGSGTTPLGLNPFHLHDGVLDLTAGLVPDAQKSSLWGFDYYSGLLTTNRSFAQTYGYFEVSVQMPTATATWPAFWLLPVGGGAPPEIDVFEYRGQEQGVLHESLHDKVFEGSQTGGTSFLPGAASGLHAYGVLWDPQHVTYYVDGRQVYQVDTPADMNKPMYLIVNMAVGAWAGTPDPSQFGGKASTLTVDYVRAYSLDQANAAVAQTAATADATKATADAAAKAAADKAAADAAAKAASDKAAADAAAKAASDKAAADAAAKAAADKAAADAAAKAAADKAAADAAAKAAADKAAADAAAKAAADKAAADAKAAADKAVADAAAKAAADKAAADAKAAADKAAADAAAKAASDKAAADAAAKAAADKAAADAAAKAAADKAAADAAAKAQAEADAKAAADKAAADAAAKATADKAAADAAAKAAADQAAADAAAKAQAQAALDAAAKAAADKAAADAAAKAASDKAAADAAAKAAADAAAQAAAHTDSHTDGSDVAPPVSYSLSPTLKTYAYDGAGSVSIKGNALNNLLTGGAHDDTLDGGAGLDTLVGGDGNDTYIVANAGDVVTEAVGGGTDTVFTSVSWTVTPGSEIESLVATGSASVTLVGNAHAMSITGNAGLNTLDDGGAADTLAGGGGNDTYIVRNADTVVIEAAGAGYDTVKTSLSAYHLTDNVEVLTYTGSASFAGTGNAGANLITGGDGNDTLDGGGGGDRLVGGKGDDTYVIRSASDVVVEKAGGGFDVELATINTVRAAENVEVLKFVGVGNFTGYANLPGTDVIGGAGNDSLWGSKGADTLEGGGGNDLLFGGAGSDVFKLAGPGAGVARILDFHSGEDHIALDATAFGVTSLADVSFGSAPVSGHDSLVYDAKGRLYWDAGGDPAHQTLIATLDTHPTLHASDFILG